MHNTISVNDESFSIVNLQYSCYNIKRKYSLRSVAIRKTRCQSSQRRISNVLPALHRPTD